MPKSLPADHTTMRHDGLSNRRRNGTHGGGRRRRHFPRLVMEIAEGLVFGIVTIGLIVLFFAVIPMVVRQHGTGAVTEADQGLPVTGSEPKLFHVPEVSMPPVTYDLICDDDDRELRNLFAEEISSMRLSPVFDLVDWITLPRIVLPKDGMRSQLRVANLVNGIYSDEPELSVYTDGECYAVAGFLSRWHLGWLGSSTREENEKEFEEVSTKLDSVAQELAAAVDAPENAKARETLGSDGLYMALAYRWFGTHTHYSDGIDDTSHANDIYGGMIEGETQCYGAACAMKSLLARGGIPAFVAGGYPPGTLNEAGHAWVIVRIGGRWYAIDGVGAQVMQEGDTIDLEAISVRRGKWQSFVLPVDEYLEVSKLELEPACKALMARYEEIVEPIEREYSMSGYSWLNLLPKEERDEAYREMRFTEVIAGKMASEKQQLLQEKQMR